MDETMRLIQAAHEGDKEARDTLVTSNMGLVWSVARRFAGRGYELEDLFQIGSIGLLKAVDKFDLEFEVKFSTYAVPMIMGEIKRFLRDDGMIKVSRTLKETAAKAGHVRERLNHSLGREPTMEEIAEEVGVCVEELAAAYESGVEVESIYRTIYRNEGNDICLIDKLEELENDQEKVLDRMLLGKLIEELKPDERKLIVMRYFMDKTQSQIAEEMGISQVQVSRLEKKILLSMRRKI
ncbi:MAG: RNA polymerase sporulation sigma factor SigF [Lachnospiraceae bacterium]|nr:RNA polymerase sporulation sigma factor SigF [Lachnospiraceae bacterium]